MDERKIEADAEKEREETITKLRMEHQVPGNQGYYALYLTQDWKQWVLGALLIAVIVLARALPPLVSIGLAVIVVSGILLYIKREREIQQMHQQSIYGDDTLPWADE
ncbi:MAG: hypothetical protein ACXAE3_16335 [Candidatus Kariarchaeaceae archaeon]|jgi:MFS superfamily sulfate permease-like transporter